MAEITVDDISFKRDIAPGSPDDGITVIGFNGIKITIGTAVNNHTPLLVEPVFLINTIIAAFGTGAQQNRNAENYKGEGKNSFHDRCFW